jgi:hypothetical protein
MKIINLKQVTVLFLLSLPLSLLAHQPVMDMAPRWEGGYGIQTRYVVQDKATLFEGKNSVSNPLGLQSTTSTLWLEGVYTFTREKRVSVKVPYVSRTSDSFDSIGLGDTIVGFLNKWYFNKKGLTGNLSLTPSIKLPTGKQDTDLLIGSGTIDAGLSVSASVEAYKYYGMWDLFTWVNSKQGNGETKGSIIGFDSDWGIHPYHDMVRNMGIFAIMSVNARHYNPDNGVENVGNTGGQTLEIAPTLVWYKNNIMARGQYHIPIYTNLNGTQLAPSSGFQLGIGIAFN